MKDYLGTRSSAQGAPQSKVSGSWERQPKRSVPAVDNRQADLASVGNALQRAEDNGAVLQAKTGIPDEVRTNMESAFNSDFSNVRVHTNSAQAKSIGAVAYTRGNDVHFAPGKYNPGSSSGKQLLGHELAHVVQQRQGRVKPTGSVGGMPLNDSPSLEAEADRMGARAAAHKVS